MKHVSEKSQGSMKKTLTANVLLQRQHDSYVFQGRNRALSLRVVAAQMPVPGGVLEVILRLAQGSHSRLRSLMMHRFEEPSSPRRLLKNSKPNLVGNLLLQSSGRIGREPTDSVDKSDSASSSSAFSEGRSTHNTLQKNPLSCSLGGNSPYRNKEIRGLKQSNSRR